MELIYQLPPEKLSSLDKNNQAVMLETLGRVTISSKKAFPDFILFSNNWSFIGQLGTLSSQLNVKKRKFKFFKLSQNLDLNLASHGQLDDV